MYSVDLKQRQLSLKQEHELSREEDAPMTIAVDLEVPRPLSHAARSSLVTARPP